jgi:hypothetical protein
MLIKDNQVKWTTEEKGSFDYIKRALTEVPVLVIPDYSKYFMVFSFSSKHTIA